MPVLKQVAITDIDEPQSAMRVSMDDTKLDELQDSLAKVGLLQPIGLKPAGDRWEIEYGHRRFIAARNLGWMSIMALCFAPGEVADGAAMLAENTIREDASAAEEALMFAEARERFNLDEAGLVARFRRKPDYIADRLRLLAGDQKVFAALVSKQINFSVARELNKCRGDEMRWYFLEQAIRGENGARTISQWVANHHASLVPQPSGPAPAPQLAEHDTNTAPAMSCIVCGGHLDPYNLVNVFIHKHELERILRVMHSPPGES